MNGFIIYTKTVAKRKIDGNYYYTGNFKSNNVFAGFKFDINFKPVEITYKKKESDKEYTSINPQSFHKMKEIISNIKWFLSTLQWCFNQPGYPYKLNLNNRFLISLSDRIDQMDYYMVICDNQFVRRRGMDIEVMPVDMHEWNFKKITPSKEMLKKLDDISFGHRVRKTKWGIRQVKYGHTDINPYADYS